MRRTPRGTSLPDLLPPPQILSSGLQPRAQLGMGMGLGLGPEGGIPLFLVVHPLWEGVEGRDQHVLLHLATGLWTPRSVETQAVEIKPAYWPCIFVPNGAVHQPSSIPQSTSNK